MDGDWWPLLQTFPNGRSIPVPVSCCLSVSAYTHFFIIGWFILFYFVIWQKKSRHRTTLPHSSVQYHRREASYRSCSGWEREFQACYRHREKIYKKEGRKAGRRECCKYNVCCLICWVIVEMWRACLFSLEPSWRTVWKKKGGQASRRISTGKLKTLLFLHLRPIEVVVYDPPSGILLFRDI